MEPVGECNLAQYLSSHCTNEDRLSILRSLFGCLANAVTYLHDSRIRHCDIKPQNIIILDEKVFLADFGIARSWEALTKGPTTTSDFGKTVQYAAPEVMRREKRNESADVWSLGCVFFEMATVLGSTRSPKRSVADWEKYTTKKTGSKSFYENVEHFEEWAFPHGHGGGDDDDTGRHNTPFAWALEMLNTDRRKRPTAKTIARQVSLASEEQGVSFCCGMCCSEETVADTMMDDEGDNSDGDDPWAD